MIGVVALLSRPRLLPDVLANFERQAHTDKLLVVVENGAGVGTVAKQDASVRGTSTVHVVRSAPDRSAARNAGIAYLRGIGVEHWAFFEDDDLYGPGYLAEHWANRDRADVLGKISYQLLAPDGSRWLLHKEWQNRRVELVGPRPPGYLNAAPVASTLFGRTDRALAWPEPCPPYAEELDWCTDMLRSGLTLYSTSWEHFVRRRFEDDRHAHATPGSWRDEVSGGVALSP